VNLHPRLLIYNKAKNAMEQAVWGIIESDDLTYWEVAKALNEIAAGVITYAIRSERHPNDLGKKGDEE
jgi:hypothetical protein